MLEVALNFPLQREAGLRADFVGRRKRGDDGRGHAGRLDEDRRQIDDVMREGRGTRAADTGENEEGSENFDRVHGDVERCDAAGPRRFPRDFGI